MHFAIESFLLATEGIDHERTSYRDLSQSAVAQLDDGKHGGMDGIGSGCGGYRNRCQGLMSVRSEGARELPKVRVNEKYRCLLTSRRTRD